MKTVDPQTPLKDLRDAEGVEGIHFENHWPRKETNSGNGKIARSYKILYSILKTWTRLESNEKT